MQKIYFKSKNICSHLTPTKNILHDLALSYKGLCREIQVITPHFSFGYKCHCGLAPQSREKNKFLKNKNKKTLFANLVFLLILKIFNKMKNIFYKIVPAFLLVFCFTATSFSGCKKDNHTAKFVSIEYGGCYGQTDFSEQERSVENDTIIFNFQNDTLKVSVGINYICCSVLDAIQIIDNNNILLQITDNTPSEDIYCRCECYYTFDYYFTDLSEKSYVVNVILDAQDDSKDKSFSKIFNTN